MLPYTGHLTLECPFLIPLEVLAHSATSCLGLGRDAHYRALVEARSGLRANEFTRTPLATSIGRVDGLEDSPLPAAWLDWDCRNNRLAWLALNQDGLLDAIQALSARFPAHRLGVALGTSTASIGETEDAYLALDADGNIATSSKNLKIHQPHSLSAFVQFATGWHGPVLTVSTACSSGAKAWAVAARWLAQDLCDAVLVGGCDTLCGSTLHGFASLELTSAQPCRPFDRDRDGISIGEAAAFAIVARERVDIGGVGGVGATGLRLAGYGESADAHHMSAPHPEGEGARRAIDAALQRASVSASDIDYINLHGTASRLNDQVEASLIARMFPPQVRISSTKGWTGHTLGAAGAIEATICLLALEHGFMPGTLNCVNPDPACGEQLLQRGVHRRVARALSNSFGFGGNNASLLFERSDAS